MAYARKAINFDLSTAELKKYFKNTSEAYRQIKSFMLKNGFEHRQYSGYTSIEKLHDYNVTELANELKYKFHWIHSCTNKFDVTDIGEQHDLKDALISPKPQREIPSLLCK